MDATTINKINLLSPENMEELRLFLNVLLKKQEKNVDNNKNTQTLEEEEEEKLPFRHPLADMEPIPVTPDIIIDRYSIYED